MLESIIRGSIRNRVLVLMLAALIFVGGLWALRHTTIDAIPDLSDTQVIVYAEYRGQSPRTIEDQVTYPLTTSLLAVPGAQTVRGYSFFGYSLVYVIFKDGTDLYWARSRVLEILNSSQNRLPAGVNPSLGPDGTGVGWVYEYALRSKTRSLAELRSLQDFYLKSALASVEDVSEIASLGGYVKQYLVEIDPIRLLGFGLTPEDVAMALRRGNADVGAEVIEAGEAEYMIRGLGYLRGVGDIEAMPLRADRRAGNALRIGDVGRVIVAPAMRRGLADLDGEGEVVGGVVVMRQGGNALRVIEGVQKKLKELQSGLPPDVEIIPTYDRSHLIREATGNLRRKLIEEMAVVALVCGVFLLHVRSALVAVVTLPLAVLAAFLLMRAQGISANIMSLGGIAIAVGAMVDGAIILIENAHKHMEREAAKPADQRRDRWELVADSAVEVGPALFFSLLVITVSFLPVFVLGRQEGKLFQPLAFTKTYAMGASAILAVTLIPILIGYFIRGGLKAENVNPINRFLQWAYRPLAEAALKYPRGAVMAAILAVGVTAWPFLRLGSEFMPPLFEGDLLYMPTTLPGIGIAKAKSLLEKTDSIIASFPEVDQVFGKIGRAETATDPAGLDMIETTIRLKPRDQWRAGTTPERLIREMDEALKLPGLTNAWTMPIKNRIDMQSTGIKTPIGIKISGPDLDTLEALGRRVESALLTLPHTASAFAERTVGGNYLDIEIRREEAANLGVNIADIQEVLQVAVGGMPITTTIEGLERYAVALRYQRELRDSPEALGRLPIPLPMKGQVEMPAKGWLAGNGKPAAFVPLSQVADIRLRKGPMVIRSEDARPNSWVFVDLKTSDLGGYAREARDFLKSRVPLPAGYDLAVSGEFAAMERSRQTLAWIIPITLLIIVLLLFLNTKSLARTLLVLAAIPFSLIGAVWLLYLLDYNMSVAVWIGLIALGGLDAETGVVMLLYLDRSFSDYRRDGRLRNHRDLREAILHGAVQRVRPKIMTAAVIFLGLLPILFGHGAGSDVMKRIAAPMAGGVFSSVLLELAVYPAVYFLWRKKEIPAV